MGLGARDFLQDAALHTDILRVLSQEEKGELHRVLLDMLRDVISVCKEYNFCYMLVYGSALGAVRHGGFIPWDDDLDIGILRKDYIPFLEKFREVLPDKYKIEYPERNIKSSSIFAKIYLKGTRYVEIFSLSCPFQKGVFLDIFPIENMPNNIIKHKIYGLFFDIILYISNSVRFYEYPNPEFKKYMSYSRYSRCFYSMRLMLGFLFSFFSHAKWYYLYNKWISCLPESNFCGMPITVRRHFLRSRLPRKTFIPTTIGFFEGIEIYLPCDYHGYLKSTYGNYMKIPDIHERERHPVVEFDLGKYGTKRCGTMNVDDTNIKK
jgi:lipopolysaccharide cholinephosphotransferase